jgi:hypothetical protein
MNNEPRLHVIMPCEYCYLHETCSREHSALELNGSAACAFHITTLRMFVAGTLSKRCLFENESSCGLVEDYQRFRANYCSHLQIRRVSRASKRHYAYCFLVASSSNCIFLKIEAICPSETSVKFYQATWRQIFGKMAIFKDALAVPSRSGQDFDRCRLVDREPVLGGDSQRYRPEKVVILVFLLRKKFLKLVPGI